MQLEQQNAALQQEQAQLRQSEARYRQVVEKAPISIVFVSADGCLIEGNRAFEQMYGITIAQLTQQNFNIFIDPQLVENGTLPYMQRALAGETVVEPAGYYNACQTVEGGRFLRGQGHYFPIRDGLSRVQEIVEICPDVTALYKAQQATLQAEQARSQPLERHNTELQQTLDRLTKSEERYSHLMELASEGIFRAEYEEPIPVNLSVDEQVKQIYQHFQLAEHNLAYAEMFGYDHPNALVGVPLTDFHVVDAPENAVQMEQFVRDGHQMRNQETVELDRFGRKRHFLNNGFSIIQNGYAIGAWGTQIDITELRETQQALLLAEQARSQALEHHNAELQQTLDRLTESECRYRQIMDIAGEGICRVEYEEPISVDLPVAEQLQRMYQHFRVVEHNLTFAQMYGYDQPNALVGTRLTELHAVDNPETIASMTQFVRDGWCNRNMETVEVDRFGRKLHFLNNTVTQFEARCATSAWVTQTDITDLRETQQALLETEQARSAELEKVEALKRSLDSLATEPSLDKFLGQVFRGDRLVN